MIRLMEQIVLYGKRDTSLVTSVAIMCLLRILLMCCLLHLQQEYFASQCFALKLGSNISRCDSCSTSVAVMVQLLPVERKHVQILAQYVRALEARRQLLRSGLAEMRQIQRHNRKPSHLQYFTLVRRLTADWSKWLALMRRRESQSQSIRRLRNFVPLPMDLVEASAGVLIIQTGYELLPQDMANGLLDGVQYNVTLSTFDRFELGWSLYDKGKFVDAAEWIRLAIASYKVADVELSELLGLRLSDMLLLYAQCFWHSNMQAVALQSFKNIEALALYDVQFSQQKLHLVSSILERPRLPPIQKLRTTRNMEGSDIPRICRFSKQRSNLKCRYKNDSPAFLILAPIKMEDVNLNPHLVLFHDVLYDNEIALIKRNSLTEMQRALIYNSTTKMGNVDESRTTQGTWLDEDQNWVVTLINRRIADMTGLRLKESEDLLVLNYGLGGYYDTHYDYLDISDDSGERFATVLLYMNDVTQGGATSFADIGNIIHPKKGTALLWENLDGAGKINTETLHCACPVIVGSKWLMTKWIRSGSQMFTRPCPKDFPFNSYFTIDNKNF